jgi:hypothetical protein
MKNVIDGLLERLGYSVHRRKAILELRNEVASLRERLRGAEQAAPLVGGEKSAPSGAGAFSVADVVPFSGFTDGRTAIPQVDALPDEELRVLNTLLPWAAFVVDQRGRRFGNAWSKTKRNVPQIVPDLRIVELDERIPLRNRSVLEIGCFEGIHTVALCQRARHVAAVDSRIENVVKTIVRCAMFGQRPLAMRWDVEGPPPSALDPSWDVMHHVGVLYHLADPVGHVRRITPIVREMLMLDTHVAPEGAADSEYLSGEQKHRYYRYREGGRADPFSGMGDHAKWLLLDDLKALLVDCGFTNVHVASLTAERNGPRALIYANR